MKDEKEKRGERKKRRRDGKREVVGYKRERWEQQAPSSTSIF